MPNWVSNQLNITGSKEELDRFEEQAGQSYTTKSHVMAEEGLVWKEDISFQVLSFWNFLKPSDDILDEYWGDEPRLPFEEAIQHKTNHWYDWNVRNWGCKWDASYIESERQSDTSLVYTFETPWSPPEPVFQEMVASYPKLDFEYRYLEEQGWGGEVHASGGTYWVVDEWDIPDTHQDRMDKIGYCHCEEVGPNDDLDYLFSDCPPVMNPRKTVKAFEEVSEQAHQASQATL